jgi:hypothetical protein
MQGVQVTDRELWDGAVKAARVEFASFSSERKAEVLALALAIQREKRAIAAFGEKISAAVLCAACGGRCCEKGKYHFTALDLLVFFVTGTELFVPSFAGLGCPFLRQGACLMEPAFRPFICVTFHCEVLEARLEPPDLARVYELESLLRNHYERMERLFGKRLGRGLLLSYEQYCRRESAGIFVNGISG